MTLTIDVIRDIDGEFDGVKRLCIRPIDAEGLGVALVIECSASETTIRERLFDLDPDTLQSLVENWEAIPHVLDWMEAFSFGRYAVLRFRGSEISAYLGARVFTPKSRR